MTKEEFNKLEVLEQLEFINNLLAEGKSLRIISGSLSMSKTTFRDRFIKIGYIYDANTIQYEKDNILDKHMIKDSLKSTNKVIYTDNIDTPIEPKEATEKTEKPQNKIIDDDDDDDDDAVSINKELLNALLEQLKVKDIQLNEFNERLKQEQELNKNNQVLQLRQPQMKQLEEHFELLDEKLMNIREKMDIKETKKGFLKRMFNK